MKANNKELEILTRLFSIIGILFMVVGLIFGLLLFDPELKSVASLFEEEEVVDTSVAPLNESNLVENGVHVRTGLVDGEGLMAVVNNCTGCHSALLVTQNRMNEERWLSTIKWMQETQNLWDLGENQEVIVNYLVTNYPPIDKGRRANLQDVEWYQLEE